MDSKRATANCQDGMGMATGYSARIVERMGAWPGNWGADIYGAKRGLWFAIL